MTPWWVGQLFMTLADPMHTPILPGHLSFIRLFLDWNELSIQKTHGVCSVPKPRQEAGSDNQSLTVLESELCNPTGPDAIL